VIMDWSCRSLSHDRGPCMANDIVSAILRLLGQGVADNDDDGLPSIGCSPNDSIHEDVDDRADESWHSRRILAGLDG
jgi:hypothetical protein